ncbi:MAG: flagellar biosynthesis protein FliA, partial [Rhizobacter sp.]|nr:flagellar biosynthesis protein FliA [Rhizobacter sp.]
TAIVLCRLEKFFATLPARDRQLIDTYLGVGLTPSDLAKTLNVTPSRVSQLCRAAYERIAQHFGNPVHREAERRCHGAAAQPGRHVDIEARERQLAQESGAPGWGVLIEKALEGTDAGHESGRIEVTPHTRWG